MAHRRDRTEQTKALAETLFRLMREHELAHTTRLKVTPALSRILENSPAYRRQRGRLKRGAGRAAKEPSFFTLLDAAGQLEVPICALTPTIAHEPITAPQRQVLTQFARWTLANFAPREDERAAFANDFDSFEPYVTFSKRSHTLAASLVGTDPQFEVEDAEVLKSIRGISDERLQLITVRGNSMADVLLDGDRLLVDIERRTPRNGDVVAVDREHLGRTLGVWRRAGKRCFLDKYNAPTIELGPPDEWRILGTVTAYVYAPLRRPR